jgi:ribose-phosphate pyrophosphokinase
MARAYAKRLNAELVLIDKRRPKANQAEVMNIIGTVHGKNVLIVDDLIDTGGTFCNAVHALKKSGAKQVFGACTHPLLSGNSIERIGKSEVSKVFITDSIALDSKITKNKKFEILSVSTIFAEAINRAFKNQSISSLFDIVKE